MTKTKTKPFEESIAELEHIVAQLERGELSLEIALKQFECGVQLARQCEKVLTNAEQKIETLSQQASSNPTEE